MSTAGIAKGRLRTIVAAAVASLASLAFAVPPGAVHAQEGADAFHMTLVGHADMQSCGEGFAMKTDRSGRRILYVAHESGPHCFSVFDVTDPARPRTLRVVDTVSPAVRCNSLDVSDNVLVVAAETKEQGQPGGSFRLYALDDPAAPRLVSYFDASGPHMAVWDIADETKPRLMSVVPYAQNSAELCKRGGRYGPHNIFEDKPYGPTFKCFSVVASCSPSTASCGCRIPPCKSSRRLEVYCRRRIS